jgi:MoaA/NifB/PqqE/SkfB family radical SAM enzyme
VRPDLPGRFNEFDVLRRRWALYAATVDGTVLPPYEVLIHPSSACNLRCVWCIGDHVPVELWDPEVNEATILEAAKTAPERLEDALVEPENMLKLVRDIVGYRVVAPYRERGQTRAREFRVEAVSFSGLIGEPLVARRALGPAIELLLEHDVRVGIFTNGVLMDDRVIDVLVRAAYVHLSLDAGTPATYAALKFGGRIAGEIKFRQAVANLRRLVERRRATPGSRLEINASFIVYPGNYHELYEAAYLLREIGVDRLRLKQDISGDRLLDPEQRQRAIALVDRIRRELVSERFQLLEIHRMHEPTGGKRRFDSCSITNLMAAVGSDGHLYPCNYHPRPGGASYGSAIETSFREVWEGTQRMRMRGELPCICPKVCDPFKNRANEMLAAANAIVSEHGLDALSSAVDELGAEQA